eukprot:6192103-Pleurochrysis_carterae.AAC.2
MAACSDIMHMCIDVSVSFPFAAESIGVAGADELEAALSAYMLVATNFKYEFYNCRWLTNP